MQDLTGNQGTVNSFGPKTTLCRARFAGQAVTAIVLSDNFGIKSVVQSSTTSGLYTVTLAEKYPEFTAKVWINGEATRIHECVITAENFAAGTFTFQHYYGTAARATVPDTLTAGAVANGTTPACLFHILVVGRGAM